MSIVLLVLIWMHLDILYVCWWSGSLYCDVMSDLLDRHCPVVTVRRRARSMTPWFDADCSAARRCARAVERRYLRQLRRRRCSDADRQDWKVKLKEMYSVYEARRPITRRMRSPPARVTCGDFGELSIGLLMTGLMARPGTTPPMNLRA